MKKVLISMLMLALSVSLIVGKSPLLVGAISDPLGVDQGDALYVGGAIQPLIVGAATHVDGTFTFNTNGTYLTINENLNNGFAVQIVDGGGDLVLTGNQTANLTINNGLERINIINGNSNKTIYLENADVHLVNTRVDTTNNYAIDVRSHSRLYVDPTSYVRSVNGYSSAIIVNSGMIDIQMVIDGTVESNQQVIGNDGGTIDSIIVNGHLKSNANYGLITTITGRTEHIEFTSTSTAVNPPGLVVYDVGSQASIGDIILNGTIDTRSIVTVGSTNNPSQAGVITFNGQAIVRGGAFYLNGVVTSLIISPTASIEQVINSYGIVYTNVATNITHYHVLGSVTASYLLVDSYQTSFIKDLLIDPVDLSSSAIVTVQSMLWVTGHVESIVLSPSIIEVDGLSQPFNFRNGSIIDSLVVDQSIVDTQINGTGVVFNNLALSNILSMQLMDTLLFGSALNVNVESVALTHVEPTIVTSNVVTSNGVMTLDVELPDLTTLTNFSQQGVKLTYMFDDYTHGGDFMYYGGIQNVTVPNDIATSNRPFHIVNYAQYDLLNSTILTSNRSIQYDVVSYQLDFNLNGGDGLAPDVQRILEGGKATAVTNPTRTGFIFKEWNTMQDGTGTAWDFTTTTMPANDVTLYAQWQELFQLSFDLNGGDGLAPTTQDLIAGSNAQTVSQPTRTGFIFKEWNTMQDGTGTAWNFTTTTMPANDVTLYAQWQELFQLSFHLNGGDGLAPTTQDLIAGSNAQTVSQPIRTGFIFREWNTMQDGTGTAWDFTTTTMPANDVMLYAQWQELFQLSFNLNGGEGSLPIQDLIKGSLAQTVILPTRTGFTFKEWNTNQDGSGTTWDFTTTTMPATDVTLYAQWTPIIYHLSFDLNNGMGMPPLTQKLYYGDLATPVTVPTRNGYEFISWNTKQDGTGINWNFAINTMPASDVSLYANWRKLDDSKKLPDTGVVSHLFEFSSMIVLGLGMIVISKKSKRA